MLRSRLRLAHPRGSRGIFFGFRLLNKEMPKFKQDVVQRYPAHIYYKSLQIFQQRTRSMVPGSDMF